MTSAMTVLGWIALLVIGLAVRFSLFLIVLAAVAVPALALVGAMAGWTAFRRRALGVRRIDGFVWRADLAYAPGHTWISRKGADALTVGIDDLAQRLLRHARAVRLPRPGTLLRQGEPAVLVTAGNKRAAIASPITGTVTKVNEEVTQQPALIHRDPYMRGWLFTLAPAGPGYKGLLTGDPARRWLQEESARLAQFVEHGLGMAAADGGDLLFPLPSLLTDEQWRALTSAFLNTA